MKKNNQIARLIQSNKKEIRFFIVFILLFFLLQTVHFIARPHTTAIFVHKLNTGVSSKIINIITPDEKSVSKREYINSGGFSLKIDRGCEGIEGILLLIAAIISYPVKIRSKLYGIFGGILIIYGFNLLRIVGLYYILKYKPNLFDMMHIYVGQTVIIIVALMFFIIWLDIQENIHGKTG